MSSSLRFRVVGILAVLLAARLVSGQAVTATPLPLPLDRFPFELGDWRGAEAPAFDAATVRVLNADAYLHRVYEHAELGPASLFVAYYGSQEHGEAIHSPQNCLPGSGWAPVEQSRIALAADGANLPLNRYLIERRGERQLVLYWFQGRGRVVASEYLNKAWLFRDALIRRRSDGALARVIVPGGEGRQADVAARAFAREVLPRLGEWLP